MNSERLLPFTQDRERLLVVLDLDLTLINARSVLANAREDLPLSSPCDLIISNDEVKAMGFPLAPDKRLIWLRNGLQEFLREVSEFADIVVWTLSQLELGLLTVEKFDKDKVVKAVIGRDNELFRGVSREVSEGKDSNRTVWSPAIALPPVLLEGLKKMKSSVNRPFFIKDLSVLGVPLSRTVIVEDWNDLCVFNPDNAFIVPQFDGPESLDEKDENGDENVGSGLPHDNTLMETVLPMLKKLADTSDVRPTLRSLQTVKQDLEARFSSGAEYRAILAAHRHWCKLRRPWSDDYETLMPQPEMKYPDPSSPLMHRQKFRTPQKNANVASKHAASFGRAAFDASDSAAGSVVLPIDDTDSDAEGSESDAEDGLSLMQDDHQNASNSSAYSRNANIIKPPASKSISIPMSLAFPLSDRQVVASSALGMLGVQNQPSSLNSNYSLGAGSQDSSSSEGGQHNVGHAWRPSHSHSIFGGADEEEKVPFQSVMSPSNNVILPLPSTTSNGSTISNSGNGSSSVSSIFASSTSSRMEEAEDMESESDGELEHEGHSGHSGSHVQPRVMHLKDGSAQTTVVMHSRPMQALNQFGGDKIQSLLAASMTLASMESSASSTMDEGTH